MMAWRAMGPLSGERQRTASLRWFALRREGPEEESPGKDRKARRTSSSQTWMGVGGGDNRGVGGGARGCLAFISSRVSGEGWARP